MSSECACPDRVRSANLDLESPWAFKLRNPKAAALETHAGVLEFIAEEGVVYLPPWVRPPSSGQQRQPDPTSSKLTRPHTLPFCPFSR